ncbi:hypothetical protein PK98_01850 [Croceibacterium mercuriale]|uniref:Autotransporter domain-containing protein n=1 Tax=Croceibacterium mercuriale TaxID=1572751 RepID=A0A0B2BZY9_9SPHN|nr:hypothetical protein [Croceibacterium mercuriale]KHL25465.1 hypothetical protein PK98_01850 [Croceibacterium mercuriale]
MAETCTVRLRRGSFVLGTSMFAIGTAFASPAVAQCAPHPTQAGGITICAGTDNDGLSVSTRSTTINVLAGAQVDGPMVIGIPDGSSWDLERATVDVQGRIDGRNGAGIDVLPAVRRPGSFSSPQGTAAVVTIGAGGVVTGAVGIRAPVITQNTFSRSVLTIDNAGTISGTTGIAVAADSDGFGTGSNITNRQGGTIGAIRGPVGRLDNAGVIDGGSLSAIDTTASFDELPGVKANSGTIRSSSSAATLRDLTPAYARLTNTGAIANSGSGAALGGRDVRLDNLAGGVVTGGTNGMAIDATNIVVLVNRGRIEGDVMARATFAGMDASTIDSVGGIIDGDVTLGRTNDTLFARYDGSASLFTGITGAIDGGTGTDIVQVRTIGDLVINTPVALFTGFEQLGLDVAKGGSVVLGANFVAPGAVVVTGAGTVINRGTIEVAGQALTGRGAYVDTIINDGTIRSTATDGYDFAVRTDGAFTNAGTVEAVGRGIYASGPFTNSGTVTAGNTGVIAYGGVNNSGTIRSTGGVGLEAYGGSDGIATPRNSGLIEGSVAGVVLNGALVNSGTIRSAGTGISMGLAASVENLAGGTITGGTQAIGSLNGGSLYNAVVRNAGTINGDVILGGPGAGYAYSRFFAEDGGVLNGNLTLGASDVLITSLINAGPGQFAGINGRVVANGGNLRYRVAADAEATYAPPSGFGSTGYEVAEGATLVLKGNGTTAQTLTLAGAGTADVTVDISTNGKQAIFVTAPVRADGRSPISSAMNVISRGSLTMERVAGDYTAASTAVLLTGQTFTNAGTITLRETGTPVPYPYDDLRPAAIRDDIHRESTVINDGTINLAGAIGVRNVASLTNTGSIVQVAGAAATAARQVQLVTNSGTIRTDGPALQEIARVENLSGGTIASASGFAV